MLFILFSYYMCDALSSGWITRRSGSGHRRILTLVPKHIFGGTGVHIFILKRIICPLREYPLSGWHSRSGRIRSGHILTPAFTHLGYRL